MSLISLGFLRMLLLLLLQHLLYSLHGSPPMRLLERYSDRPDQSRPLAQAAADAAAADAADVAPAAALMGLLL